MECFSGSTTMVLFWGALTHRIQRRSWNIYTLDRKVATTQTTLKHITLSSLVIMTKSFQGFSHLCLQVPSMSKMHQPWSEISHPTTTNNSWRTILIVGPWCCWRVFSFIISETLVYSNNNILLHSTFISISSRKSKWRWSHPLLETKYYD